MKVPSVEIKEALEYLGIPVSDSLEKSIQAESLEGSEQNGGGTEENSLQKKKEELSSKVEKAKKDLEDLEKEQKELEKGDAPGKVEAPKGDGEESGESEELEKSKRHIEVLEKSVTSLTTLTKSQHQTLETLTNNFAVLSEKFEEFLSAPQERRSAQGVNELRKSMGFSEIDQESGKPSNPGTIRMSIMEKSRVSNSLMNIYQEGGCEDTNLANMITTYEASGHLPQQGVDLLKSKGIEILK